MAAVSFLHRFGSALNRHMHLHACGADGVFVATDAPDGVAFLPARPISSADLAALTEPLEPPPLPPARGPPIHWPELVQAHDDRDVVQAAPDGFSAIDIHAI
jgi:hypothetical protein